MEPMHFELGDRFRLRKQHPCGNFDCEVVWLGQVISMTVFNASNFALLILITNITNSSTTAVGAAVICFSLPAVIFGAPAGVFVDHMDKHRVLWGSNCLRALATVLFVGVLMMNQ